MKKHAISIWLTQTGLTWTSEKSLRKTSQVLVYWNFRIVDVLMYREIHNALLKLNSPYKLEVLFTQKQDSQHSKY